jgi:hypothetical protein
MDFYRPREAIFSIATNLCDRPEHHACGDMLGVVGSRKSSQYVSSKPARYDPDFEYIDADLGGYGLYYSTTMTTMGLVVPALGGTVPVDAPTPIGRAVADAFRMVIGDTTYYTTYFDHPDKKVPTDVLVEYIRRACLCQLHDKGASDQHLLQDVFLHGGNTSEAENRKQSLRLILDIADQANGTAIDQEVFRQLIYYWPQTQPVKYRPRADLLVTARRWRLYQAREYYSYALNRLWEHLCAWGIDRTSGGIRSVPVMELWEHLSSALEFEQSDLDAASSLAQLVKWVTKASGATGTLDDTWLNTKGIDEHQLYGRAVKTEGDYIVAQMVAMLALLYARLGSPELAARYEQEWGIVREGGVLRLSMNRFFHLFRRDLMAGQTIGEFTRTLVSDYVIRQHERVALAKLPDDTFRFRREGDHLRFFNLSAVAGMNNSRFQALATTVSDLGWVSGLACADRRLSPLGRRLLETGDLPEANATPLSSTKKAKV